MKMFVMYTLIFTDTQLPLEAQLFPFYKVGHLKRIYILFIFYHCTTSQNIIGSIHDGVIEAFHWLNPSGHTRPINSISNRNKYPRYILRDKGGRCIGLTTLAPSCADYLEILAVSTSWSLKGLSRPIMEELYVYLHLFFISRGRPQFK